MKIKYWTLLSYLLRATLNAKINEVKKEIPSNVNLSTTTALITVENKIPEFSNIVKKKLNKT